MKLQGINCELISEYAKDMVWREMNGKAFADQLYITAKQHHRQYRCAGKVDYLITDSPLLLSLAYIPENYFENFKPLVLEIFNSFDNFNVLIKRVKPYNPIGRNQDEAGSDAVGRTIESYLDVYCPGYVSVNGDESAPRTILSHLFGNKGHILDFPMSEYMGRMVDGCETRPLIYDPEHYEEDAKIQSEIKNFNIASEQIAKLLSK